MEFAETYFADLYDEQERQQRRCIAAAGLAMTLEHIIVDGLIDRIDAPPYALAWERHQRKHITRYMRFPKRPDYSDQEHKMGDMLDHLLLKTCDVILLWEQVGKTRKAMAYRRHRERMSQIEREERLRRRRIRKVEESLIAKPMPKVTVSPIERVERERCEKCHKRPAVHSHLCQSCLNWEKAKLGRE
jgi:hypothetical protein